jgi:quinol monooxygenase YgiN
MIVITVRFPVKPEYADTFLDELREGTQAVRDEPGCLWYIWARNAEDPSEFVLTEGYRDAEAGADHVTPKIIFSDLGPERTGWDDMGELQIG